MRHISPHALWLGHAGDGEDFRSIFDAGIKAVVQLAAEEAALQLPRQLIYCRFPVIDGPGNRWKLLHLATTTVANLLEKRIAVLVCCGGGMSRSPAIAAAALATAYHLSPDECLKKIAEHHSIDVVPALWNDVKSCLDAPNE